MKTEIADLSSVKKRLTIEVPASDVAAVFEHLVRRARRNVQIPGYRAGKAPVELVKARLGHDLEHEAAEAIVEDFGREACRQEGLTPIWSDIELPEGVDHLPHPHEGEDYRFTLLVEVLPKVDPVDYTGHEISKPEVEVQVEEIQAELDAMRQSQGKLVDVADRASETGDLVGIEIEGREGDAVVVAREFRVVRLGDERNLPEFESNLAGKRAEDEFAFDVTYPADLPDEKLAGKTVRFQGTVKALKKMEVPEWTDELAQAFKAETYAELRERVKSAIEARKAAEAVQVARRRLLDRVMERNPFEVPAALVEQELRDRLERIGRRLSAQGLDPDKLEVDWNKVIEEERQRAEQEVREGLLLDRVAEKEKEHVVVDRSDMEQVIESMARDMEMPVPKLKNLLQKDGRMASLEREVRRTKCLDWLYSQSHIS